MSTRTQRPEEGPLRGTLLALGAQLTTAAFTAILTLYLVRALGAAGYGLFALALSIAVIVALLADVGVAFSTSRFLAERRADPNAVAAVFAAGLRLKLILASVAALLLIALAGPLAAAYGKPELTWPLRGVAVGLWGQQVMALCTASFMALRRIAINVRVIFVESLMEMAASIALVAAGAGVTGAAFGRAIGYTVGAIVGIVMAARLIGRAGMELRRRKREAEREIARYGRPLLVTNSAYAVFGEIDVQLIGALLSARAVGLFAAPLQFITLLSYPGQAAANAIAPRMAGDTPDVAAFSTALRWLVVMQCMVAAGVLAWGEPIVVLVLGEEFRPAGDILRVLAPYIFMRGLSPLVTVTVNYLGEARRRVKLVIGCLALNAVIDLALLPMIGVIGAAVGTSIAYLVYVPVHLRVCAQHFPVPLRALSVTLARAGAAALAMGGVLALAGTRDLTFAEWLLGGAGGILAFVGVLVLLGELTAAQLRASASRLRGSFAASRRS